jgi:phosphatidylserine/phosphatidylglycerophosphate/cardiolipin synthase-like enzyme
MHLSMHKNVGVQVHFILNDFKQNDWPQNGYKYLKLALMWCDYNNLKYRLSSSVFKYTHNKYIIIDDKIVLIMTCNLNYNSIFIDNFARNFIVVEDGKSVVKYLKKLFLHDCQNSKYNWGYT